MTNQTAGADRLSLPGAAWVVARRDFTAILFSRSFLFFLLGPLFPAIVFAVSGGLGAAMAENRIEPRIALQMPSQDMAAIGAAHLRIEAELGSHRIPHFLMYDESKGAAPINIASLLKDPTGRVGATLTGTLEKPVLTGTEGRIAAWGGIITMTLASARDDTDMSYDALQTSLVASSGASERDKRMVTAQVSQTLLFLLMMLLAGMVLSNLVEEKANKIIEILAAAVPMDAVFLGKLFAMLAISLVGIAIWGSAVILAIMALGDFGGVRQLLIGLPDPGVGWPAFVLLFIVYFSMGYLLVGSVFLAIGALAATVREVQTLSMPVTMLQLFVFFFASFVLADSGGLLELVAILFPLSSPFAMVARAAQSDLYWPHIAAIAYQIFWVALFIRVGASLFRAKVMQSGPAPAKSMRWKPTLPSFKR